MFSPVDVWGWRRASGMQKPELVAMVGRTSVFGVPTMAESVPLAEVLELFESQGWRLQRISEPYRVFMKPGELPWLIPVRNRKVSVEYVNKVETFFREREKGD